MVKKLKLLRSIKIVLLRLLSLNVEVMKIILISVAAGRGLSGGTTKRGVKYSGPELASYRRGTLGPFITPRFESDRDYIANFIGTKWTMKWTGVNFPVSSRYRIRTEADDILTVKVDGEFVSEVKVREGVREVFFNASEGKRTIEMELTNANIQQPFPINPTVFNAIIDVDAEITVPAEKSWRGNPIGISAILIPPPCPLETKGLGKLCDIFPLRSRKWIFSTTRTRISCGA